MDPNDSTQCINIALATVRNTWYQVAQCVQILLSLGCVVSSFVLFKRYRKITFFHGNMKVLFGALISSAVIFSLQTIVMQIQHLYASHTYIDPCELWLPASSCSVHLVLCTSTVEMMTFTQSFMWIERAIATIWIKDYNKVPKWIGYIFSTLAVSISLCLCLPAALVKTEEKLFSCLSIPDNATFYANLYFVIVIIGNAVSIVAFIILHYVNKRNIEKYRFDVANRYQINENISTTRTTCATVSFQFVISTINASVRLVLRSRKSYMDPITQRVAVQFAYVMPYFACCLPLVLMYQLKKDIAHRTTTVSQIVQMKSAGEEGHLNYQRQLHAQWA